MENTEHQTKPNLEATGNHWEARCFRSGEHRLHPGGSGHPGYAQGDSGRLVCRNGRLCSNREPLSDSLAKLRQYWLVLVPCFETLPFLQMLGSCLLGP